MHRVFRAPEWEQKQPSRRVIYRPGHFWRKMTEAVSHNGGQPDATQLKCSYRPTDQNSRIDLSTCCIHYGNLKDC